ncbi:hypothetical protein C2W62_50440, partial [Candidatus Entotheonella serta]
MWFFSELMIHGILSGSVYALISLAFVVVYKASRMINFALGEFIMVASKLVAAGLNALGWGWAGRVGFGCGTVFAAPQAYYSAVSRVTAHFCTCLGPRAR